jgi:ribosomal protein S18 acetylase RimI-like enzyme
LLFSHLPQQEREFRAQRALELVQSGQLDSRGILVCADERELVGVCVCQVIPGAGGLIWPPIVTHEPRAMIENALLRHCCEWLRAQGSKLVQCLVADEEAYLAVPLLRNGFVGITGLTYLRHDGIVDANLLTIPRRLDFTSQEDSPSNEFQQTLLESYEGTLDCPEVNGVRTLDEVLAGHRAQSPNGRSHWWLACANGVSVGVLLLAEPNADEWEVAYMGLVPEARGQRLGQELLLHALIEARAAGVEQVILSVDDRNVLARRLYERVGFEVYDHRQVLLLVQASGAA